jgi:hypothetical protein
VVPLVRGQAADATPLERALIDLVRRAHDVPALLTPADLDPLRAIAGDDALDYLLVLCAFHFITRIADLLAVPPEVLPPALRRVETVRRVGVWMTGLLIRRMDLANRPDRASFDDARARVEALLGRQLGPALEPLRARPKVIESIALALDERDRASSLDRVTLAHVHRTVEAALPRSAEDVTGFDARPADPVCGFAFVGTRSAHRTTPAAIAALRHAGYDDLGILDLAIAVADVNQWARMYRLAGLPPELFLLP